MKILPAILLLLVLWVLFSGCTRPLELGLPPEHNSTDGSTSSNEDNDKNNDAGHLDGSAKDSFNPTTN